MTSVFSHVGIDIGDGWALANSQWQERALNIDQLVVWIDDVLQKKIEPLGEHSLHILRQIM